MRWHRGRFAAHAWQHALHASVRWMHTWSTPHTHRNAQTWARCWATREVPQTLSPLLPASHRVWGVCCFHSWRQTDGYLYKKYSWVKWDKNSSRAQTFPWAHYFTTAWHGICFSSVLFKMGSYELNRIQKGNHSFQSTCSATLRATSSQWRGSQGRPLWKTTLKAGPLSERAKEAYPNCSSSSWDKYYLETPQSFIPPALGSSSMKTNYNADRRQLQGQPYAST